MCFCFVLPVSRNTRASQSREQEYDSDSQCGSETDSQAYFQSIKTSLESESFEDGILQTKDILRPRTIRLTPINLKHNPTTSNVIQGVINKGLDIDQILCFQNVGKNTYDITFKDQHYRDKMQTNLLYVQYWWLVFRFT